MKVELTLTDRQAKFVDVIMMDLEGVSTDASVRRDARAVRRRILLARAEALLRGMREALPPVARRRQSSTSTDASRRELSAESEHYGR